MTTPEYVTLPDSGVTIRFASDYDPDKLADLTRRLLHDDTLAEKLGKDPTAELRNIGILIEESDRQKITDEDILIALGHRAGPEDKTHPAGMPVLILIAIIVAMAPHD